MIYYADGKDNIMTLHSLRMTLYNFYENTSADQWT